ARVDEVGVLLALVGERAHAEDAVLALQDHAHPGRQVIRHEGGDADPEVDVLSVLELLRGDRRHLVARPGHAVTSAASRARTVRCSISLTGSSTATSRCTKTPGVCTSSGSRNSPSGRMCSASTSVIRLAVATSGLKLRAVRR